MGRQTSALRLTGRVLPAAIASARASRWLSRERRVSLFALSAEATRPVRGENRASEPWQRSRTNRAMRVPARSGCAQANAARGIAVGTRALAEASLQPLRVRPVDDRPRIA
jgi:hypothetical protein